MTRLSRIGVLSAALVLVVMLTMIAWDAFNLDRRIPALEPAAERATKVLVEKGERRLTLLRDGLPIRTYAMSLGRDPTGHKQREGDGRTPEGMYAIDFKNTRSRFHLSLRISYPDRTDRARAQQAGVPPGGDIMIHGLPRGFGWLGSLHLSRDWTDGCVAVTNDEVEEIWKLVDVGTEVEIRP